MRACNHVLLTGGRWDCGGSRPCCRYTVSGDSKATVKTKGTVVLMTQQGVPYYALQCDSPGLHACGAC